MEEIDNLQVGYLVVSTQGRDSGRTYLIMNKIDDNHCLLVEGNHKKMINPKLKKIKHIKSLNIKLDKIQSKLNENIKVFDSEIYSAINKALEDNK